MNIMTNVTNGVNKCLKIYIGICIGSLVLYKLIIIQIGDGIWTGSDQNPTGSVSRIRRPITAHINNVSSKPATLPQNNGINFQEQFGIFVDKNMTGSYSQGCWIRIIENDSSQEDLRNCDFAEVSLDLDLDKKIDRLEKITLPLQRNYRNPCWYEKLPSTNERLYRVNKQMFRDQAKRSYDRLLPVMKSRRKSGDLWRLRCLPLVYVIGVAKCGTTDLWAQLTGHPHVTKAATKEPMYWSSTRWGRDGKLSDYLDLFDEAAEKIRNYSTVNNNTSHQVYHPRITVDMSVATLFKFDGTSHRFRDNNVDSGPESTSPQMIKNLTPDAKIILIVRNPTERLYSEYLFFNKHKKTSPDEFHSLCVEAVTRMNYCLKRWSVRHCVYNDKYKSWRKWVRLVAGMYAPFVKDWLEVFPHMHVLRTEDYHDNRSSEYTKILQYLQLEMVIQDTVKSDHISNKGPSHNFEMLPQTRKLLDDFYRPFNSQLSQLLNNSVFLYNKDQKN